MGLAGSQFLKSLDMCKIVPFLFPAPFYLKFRQVDNFFIKSNVCLETNAASVNLCLVTIVIQ